MHQEILFQTFYDNLKPSLIIFILCDSTKYHKFLIFTIFFFNVYDFYLFINDCETLTLPA